MKTTENIGPHFTLTSHSFFLQKLVNTHTLKLSINPAPLPWNLIKLYYIPFHKHTDVELIFFPHKAKNKNRFVCCWPTDPPKLGPTQILLLQLRQKKFFLISFAFSVNPDLYFSGLIRILL